MTILPNPSLATLAAMAFASARGPIVIALVILCAAIAIAIPARASKGKLHIPGYAGLSFLAFALAIVSGRLSGTRRLTGSPAGLIFAILCFLLASVAVGSLLAMFFYREPRDT